MKEVGQTDELDAQAEESSNKDSSDNDGEVIVYDEIAGLIDDPATTSTPEEKTIKLLGSLKVKCALRPKNGVSKRYLLEKSGNNINPFVKVEALVRTKVTTLLEHMSREIFKEDTAKFVLHVHQTKFT